MSVPWLGGISARPIAVYNTSGEEIPAFGLMVPVGGVQSPSIAGKDWIDVDKPSGEHEPLLVNSPKSIATAKYGHGWSIYSGPVWIAYDYLGSPAEGNNWGPVADSFYLSEDGSGFLILKVDDENDLVLATYSPRCPYYHKFTVSGGQPTSGSVVWSYTIDGDTQDVTITYSMTAAALKTEFLSEFTGLTTDDLEVFGGPLPTKTLAVLWNGAVAAELSGAWDDTPVEGANTLNNDAWMFVDEINPRH